MLHSICDWVQEIWPWFTRQRNLEKVAASSSRANWILLINAQSINKKIWKDPKRYTTLSSSSTIVSGAKHLVVVIYYFIILIWFRYPGFASRYRHLKVYQTGIYRSRRLVERNSISEWPGGSAWNSPILIWFALFDSEEWAIDLWACGSLDWLKEFDLGMGNTVLWTHKVLGRKSVTRHSVHSFY